MSLYFCSRLSLILFKTDWFTIRSVAPLPSSHFSRCMRVQDDAGHQGCSSNLEAQVIVVIGSLLPAWVLLRIVGVVGHCWGLRSVHLPASMVGPASRVVIRIIGDRPGSSHAPKSLSNQKLHSVGMLKPNSRTQRSLKSLSRCLPEPPQGVQSCLPEVGVVVQVKHVEGFLPLGEVLRLQKLGPPCPVSIIEEARIHSLPDIPERTLSVEDSPSNALLAWPR